MFVVEHSDKSFRVDEGERVALGNVTILWTSFLGDPGSVTYGPLFYQPERRLAKPKPKLHADLPEWLECVVDDPGYPSPEYHLGDRGMLVPNESS